MAPDKDGESSSQPLAPCKQNKPASEISSEADSRSNIKGEPHNGPLHAFVKHQRGAAQRTPGCNFRTPTCAFLPQIKEGTAKALLRATSEKLPKSKTRDPYMPRRERAKKHKSKIADPYMQQKIWPWRCVNSLLRWRCVNSLPIPAAGRAPKIHFSKSEHDGPLHELTNTLLYLLLLLPSNHFFIDSCLATASETAVSTCRTKVKALKPARTLSGSKSCSPATTAICSDTLALKPAHSSPSFGKMQHHTSNATSQG